MDILSKNAIEITSLAMDGLAARHKAISSNIANADSQNYKRVQVTFEDQLKRIIESEKKKEQYKQDNMFKKDKEFSNEESKSDFKYSDFKPQVVFDKESSAGKNNVNLEREMADLAKNGMKYNALAILQQKAFRGLEEVIRQGGRV